MRWRIWRIVNGCTAQPFVARQDVIAPEFISYGLVPGNQKKLVSIRQVTLVLVWISESSFVVPKHGRSLAGIQWVAPDSCLV